MSAAAVEIVDTQKLSKIYSGITWIHKSNELAWRKMTTKTKSEDLCKSLKAKFIALTVLLKFLKTIID